MYYISTETYRDVTQKPRRKTPLQHLVVVRDTDDESFIISKQWQGLRGSLEFHEIPPESVVGLYCIGDFMNVTPVSDWELRILRLLKNPEHESRVKAPEDNAWEFGHYGDYNFIYAMEPCSLARLLLTLDGSLEGRAVGVGISDDTLSVCVKGGIYYAEYLNYSIPSLEKLRVTCAKCMMLCDRKKADSFSIRWNYVEGMSNNGQRKLPYMY